jgi:CheY-like chemotaxis protein/HPt (histidine-containing phosphotransfer) domain-containing protein
MVIQGFLLKTDCHIVIAENGFIAVEKFKNGHFDAVLMDIQMPVMDGYEATRTIRVWEAETGAIPTPIIALTAHALQEVAKQVNEAGCDYYLTKPISKARLMEVLQKFQRKADTSSVPDVSISQDTEETPKFDNVSFQDSDHYMAVNMKALEKLSQDFGGGIELPLQKFLEVLPTRMNAISNTIKEGDPDGLSLAAHKLKGTSCTFGAEKLSELARQLEEMGKSGHVPKDGKLLTTIMDQVIAVQNEIKRILEG